MSGAINIVKEFLVKYASYVNQTRANVALDGLKAVQRRILFVTYKIAKDKFLKTATIAGNVVAYYHPHGNASVEDAIVGMVRNGYLEGQGNWGSKCTLEEIKPAAPRYTEVKFNDKLEFAMKYINYADFTKSEIDYDEPLLIPTPIPIGLIGNLVDYPQPQQGIGVGIRTIVPMYKFEDLVAVLEALVNNKEIPIPDPFISTYVDILQSESKKIFTTGSGKVVVRPKFTFDGSKKQLHIYALTRNLLQIIKPWKDKLVVKDLSTKYKTHIIIEPKKYQKLDFEELANTILDKMKTTINFTTYVAIPDDKGEWIVYNIGILPWLKAQFKYYLICRERFIQDKIKKLSDQLAELELIKLIRPYLVKYLQNTKHPDPDDFVNQLDDSFDKELVKQLLTKYTIKRLLSVDTDTTHIKQEIDSYKKQLETMQQDTIQELRSIKL